MDGLTPGRMVHYVLPDGRYPGEHRPAVVTKVWGANGCVQLSVFIDGTNDYANLPMEQGSFMPLVWKTSVLPDEDEKKPNTWHWIEKV